LFVRFLIGGQVIADHHAVGIATAHVGLEIIGSHTVAHAGDVGFDDAAFAGDFIGNLERIAFRAAASEIDQLLGGAGDRDALTIGQDFRCFARRMIFLPSHTAITAIKPARIEETWGGG